MYKDVELLHEADVFAHTAHYTKELLSADQDQMVCKEGEIEIERE